jgi:hypothetical protein
MMMNFRVERRHFVGAEYESIDNCPIYRSGRERYGETVWLVSRCRIQFRNRYTDRRYDAKFIEDIEARVGRLCRLRSFGLIFLLLPLRPIEFTVEVPDDFFNDPFPAPAVDLREPVLV